MHLVGAGRRTRICWSREHRCMQFPVHFMLASISLAPGEFIAACLYVLLSRDPGFGPCFGGNPERGSPNLDDRRRPALNDMMRSTCLATQVRSAHWLPALTNACNIYETVVVCLL